MVQYKKGRELIDDRGMQDFEIIALVRDGLQPLNRFGEDVVIDEIISSLAKRIKNLEENHKFVLAGWVSPIDRCTSEETVAISKKLVCELKGIIDELKKNGTSGLSLPAPDKIKEEIITLLLDSYYEIKQTDKSTIAKERRRQGQRKQAAFLEKAVNEGERLAIEICRESEKQGKKLSRDEFYDKMYQQLGQARIKLPNTSIEKIRTKIRDSYSRRFFKESGRPTQSRPQ